MLLRLISKSPAAPTLTLANGAVATGYSVLNTIDLGNASWQHALSGARGTQGARAAAGEPDNRVASIPIRIGPTGSVDSFNLKAAVLAEIVDELRRFGGRILWQATGQTPRQYLDVIGGCGLTKDDWGRKGKQVDVGTNTILAQCAPYMLGDLMDTTDGFDSNTITAGDWTRNAASTGNLTVTGGQLAPSSTGLKMYRHTVKGYGSVYRDGEVTIKVRTGPVITGGIWGVAARVDPTGGDNGIVGEIVAGTNVIRVGLFGAGASLSTQAFTPVANTTYWIRLRLDSYQATAEVFTSEPTALSTPTASATNQFFPERYYTGDVAIRVTAADTAERYDDFTVRPYTYRGIASPEPIRVSILPGDVPAMVDLELTPKGTGGTAVPIWGLAAWTERALLHNLVWNGNFENSVVGATGWSVAAVAGVIGAGSAVSRITSSGQKYGVGALQITTPATTDTGANFAMQRRARANRIWVGLAWLSSPTSTTACRLKLGVSGDLATGTASALTTTPTLYTVMWGLVTDRDNPVLAIGTNAATASTIVADGVCVVDCPLATINSVISSTSQATFTVFATPTETPGLLSDGTLGAPFLILVDNEIMRVTAIDPTTLTWSVDRGVEGTVAATHAATKTFVILPPLRPQLEGRGGPPAFGVLDALSLVNVSTISSPGAGAFSTVADANRYLGNVLRWTPATSGAQLATLVYFVDPNLLVPDDYTQGELDVELWVSEKITPTLTSPRVTVSAQPQDGSAFGPERFTREFGNLGKLLTPASSAQWRVHRLGSLPMIVDRSNPQRWRLKLTLSCTGGAAPAWDVDYLMLVPTRGRLASPTGEANDTATALGSFPAFIPFDSGWTTTSGMTKTLRADGSSLITSPGLYGYPDAGLGDVIEMPDSDLDLMLRFSNLVPDDPTIDATAEALWTYTADAHLAVTPRYIFARAV